MVEARTYAEHEGTFQDKGKPDDRPCPKCGQMTVVYQIWESSCGGYEDVKYTCTNKACNCVWWVDGIDS